jgi:hypothetical protein
VGRPAAYGSKLSVVRATIAVMNEDVFWATVADTRLRAGNAIAGQPEALRASLAGRPVDEVLGFRRRMSAALTSADTDDLQAAAGLLLGGLCDDSFLDFRTWLICHGRGAFERALADPDTLADLTYDELENDFGHAELFAYVPAQVYWQRTGQEPPEDDGPQRYDDGTLRERFPRLYARAGQLHPDYLRQRL